MIRALKRDKSRMLSRNNAAVRDRDVDVSNLSPTARGALMYPRDHKKPGDRFRSQLAAISSRGNKLPVHTSLTRFPWCALRQVIAITSGVSGNLHNVPAIRTARKEIVKPDFDARGPRGSLIVSCVLRPLCLVLA